jgi:hypothetical protein
VRRVAYSTQHTGGTHETTMHIVGQLQAERAHAG